MHIVRLKDMQTLFKNSSGFDPEQEIYKVLFIERSQLSYAITIMKPGKINGEFFMTKGHTHEIPSSEVYYLLKGRGIIIMQKDNDFKKIEMKPNKFYEIPKGYAHRTINTGKGILEVLNIYTSDSGHDYKSIEKKGFKKRIY